MKSILEEFARIIIVDDLDGYIEKQSPCDCTTDDLGDIEDKLMSLLDGEAKNTFRQFVLAQAQAELKVGIDRFIHGFRLGVLLTMEIVNSKDDLFNGGEDC